ncbi:MAG: DNA-3-methyladenine glycosylase I [Clostridia bacterium]|nr:DNA-3-methyladenine glycosylase I [Clostridia bacterium]
MEQIRRCPWCEDGSLLRKYHDEEWGEALHSDHKHFEYISLEVLQCGLNWLMMLKKREIFRACFDGFDYEKVALYDDGKVEEILAYPGMIRSPRKIDAIIRNARCFLDVRKEFGSFDAYLWGFSGGKSILYTDRQNHATSRLSDEISRDLKKRGFRYLGSITVYAHLEACGIVNDHSDFCWKYARLAENCVRMDND